MTFKEALTEDIKRDFVPKPGGKDGTSDKARQDGIKDITKYLKRKATGKDNHGNPEPTNPESRLILRVAIHAMNDLDFNFRNDVKDLINSKFGFFGLAKMYYTAVAKNLGLSVLGDKELKSKLMKAAKWSMDRKATLDTINF